MQFRFDANRDFQLAELESKLASLDVQFKAVFDAIRRLMQPALSKRPGRIGFRRIQQAHPAHQGTS